MTLREWAKKKAIDVAIGNEGNSTREYRIEKIESALLEAVSKAREKFRCPDLICRDCCQHHANVGEALQCDEQLKNT